MDEQGSLSKGCFVFKPKKTANPFAELELNGWCTGFTEVWSSVERKIKDINDGISSHVTDSLVQFVRSSTSRDGRIPTAVLLTGVNVPDHGALFDQLCGQFREGVSPHVAILNPSHCTNIKKTVEQMTSQFMRPNNNYIEELVELDSDDELEEGKNLKRVDCTIPHLLKWYNEKYEDHLFCERLVSASMTPSTPVKNSSSPSKLKRLSSTPSRRTESTYNSPAKKTALDLLGSPHAPSIPPELKTTNCQSPKKLKLAESPSSPRLIVVLPDFEAFSTKVLHSFLRILSGYIDRLPLSLVVGVATTATAISDTLEHSVLSRLSIEMFESPRSIFFLNNVLEKVFLTDDCPFQLGPNMFKFLTNVFLFYDFSICSFTLAAKYCLMDHFFNQNYKLLCTEKENLKDAVERLKKKDRKAIKELESFKKYTDKLSSEEQEALNDPEHFRAVVFDMLKECHIRISEFHLSLRLLQILVAELPLAPLGKQIRELYLHAVSGNIFSTSEYKQCRKLLGFQAKDELLEKIRKMKQVVKDCHHKSDFRTSLKKKLNEFRGEIELCGLNRATMSPIKSPKKIDFSVKSRSEFREKLAQLGKDSGPVQVGYEAVRSRLIEWLLGELLPAGLSPVTQLPLHEVLVCDASAGRASCLKRRLVGCPRADIHLALTSPQHYLQCDCCKDSEEISSSYPDICIAYKLHLESSALINMYDWLQAFTTIVDPGANRTEELVIRPQIQARFTRAVSELEFLGFIQSSKKKTDHVSRLTWGSN